MTSTFKYCLVLVFSFTGIIFLVASLNYIVNPYLIFNHHINVFNKKPESASRVRVLKKYQAEHRQYQTLIVGNSRVEMGIDPKNPLFEHAPVYNVGVPGLSQHGQLAYAKNIASTNPVKEIFLAVDFVDFLSKPTRTEYSQYVFKNNRLEDMVSASFSLDALISSIQTILNQDEFASTRRVDGFNPAKDYVPILRNEGQNVLDSQKLLSLAQQLSGVTYNHELSKSDLLSPLNAIREQLINWQNLGIKVSVFINPYQDSYYDAIRKAGLKDDFLAWIEDVQAAIQEEQKLFDFTDLGISHSLLKNENGELSYFWEPAHYKKELGDKMLEAMIKH